MHELASSTFQSTTVVTMYLQVWDKHGAAGILKLRGKLSLQDPDGGFQRLMLYSRGDQFRPKLGVNPSAPAVTAESTGLRVSIRVCWPQQACILCHVLLHKLGGS